MLSLHDKDIFNEDGTVRRKYEIEDTAHQATIRRVVSWVLALNVVILLKTILFGADTAKSSPDHSATAQRSRGVEDDPSFADSSPIVEPVKPEEPLYDEELDLKGDRHSSGGLLRYASAEEFNPEQEFARTPLANIALPGNDNTSLFGAAAGQAIMLPSDGSSIGGGSGSNGESRSVSSNTDVDTIEDDDDDDDDDDPDPRINRLPITTGPVLLGQTLTNQSIIIALADLLHHTSDADGDRLIIRDLAASSGTLVALPNGDWRYTPAINDTTDVKFTYRISDGVGAINQVADLDLIVPDDGVIRGTDGDDRIVGTDRDDIISSSNGDDTIAARAGNDVVHSGSGNSRIFGGDGDDDIFAGDGDDFVSGGHGRDVIYGGKGNDVLLGDADDDVVFGGDGTDYIAGGTGNDYLGGGAGDDTVAGDEGDDTLFGDVGNDALSGGIAHDKLVGGAGNDQIQGDTGDDTIVAEVDDGDDEIDGGDDEDTYDFSATYADAHVDLQECKASSANIGSDDVINIENIVGGWGNDEITGSDADNKITGGAGDDMVDAGAGNDLMIAIVGDGADIYIGGDGEDTLDLSKTQADAIINLFQDTAESLDIERDEMLEIENVIGGSGDDIIIAGEDRNILIGGDGDDVFVFLSAQACGYGTGRDVIIDFSVGDRIDLGQISQDFENHINDVFSDIQMQKFYLIASHQEFSQPGQIRFQYAEFNDRPVTLLQGSINHDTQADFELELGGYIDLTENSFRNFA